MTRPALSVIAPCRNEAANVATLAERTLAALDLARIAGELILVDDGSTDGTWDQITERQRHDPRVRGVRHAVNQGIEGGWRSGLDAACGERICLIDADLQNRPEDIPKLHAAFTRGDGAVIQAVRHAAAALSRHRVFTRGLNALLNLACGTRLRDHKSGFILCGKETLRDILRHRFSYRYYQALIGVAAVARGHAVAEVDTSFDPRLRGKSFLPRFPLRASLTILWELVKFRAETWCERGAKIAPRPKHEMAVPS